MRPLPEEFIQRFIRKPMRDRVAHEWKKKPERLHYRVYHKADEIFPETLKGGVVDFDVDETVLFLCGTITKEVPYSEAVSYLGSGMGALVVAVDGKKFTAETETEKGHPFETYAGSY